ncbi:unnamed protein product [Rotaria sp. Silwood1]|nr:unnamed protein product [Rotaria sp. Silwood1]CAF3863656.1 unnamed protein product [Rotaria sp. Silwood1]CAF3866000.1 unnamed protein product [Rotaria sp. Silwood1]CAF3883787.1 unnamed protein product [Rotaria sp. Silwood1]CAF4920050.1 unnamed protein product [Rotaria sp. Silwood1]
MFIKILVDFGDIPKTLLPHVLSLNPELAMHIEQLVIKQEAERRTQQASASLANRSETLTIPPINETQSAQTLFDRLPSSNVTNTNA